MDLRLEKTIIIKISMAFGLLLAIGCNETELKQLENEVNLGTKYLKPSTTPQEVEPYLTNCPSESDYKDCLMVCHVPPGNPSKRKTLILPYPAIKAHLNHGGPHHNEHDFIGHCSDVPQDNNDEGSPSSDSDNTDGTDQGAGSEDTGTNDGGDNNTGGEDNTETSGSGDTNTQPDGSEDTGTNDGGEDSTGGEDNTETSGSGDTNTQPDGSEDTSDSGSSDEDVPSYCEAFWEIDLDCDGFNDETGEPIF